MSMISAEEARNLIETDLEFLVGEELRHVEGAITSACHRGKNMIALQDYILLDETVAKLRDLGYRVDVENKQYGWYSWTDYVISWKE